MKNKLAGVSLLILLVVLACNRNITYDRFTGFTQGTTYSIAFGNNGKYDPQKIKAEIEKILQDFDMSLSLYKDSSVISKVNRNEEVRIDNYFREVFLKSAEIYKMTSGAFDPTVGPLVKAWGFGPDARKTFNAGSLDSLLKLVGLDKIRINDETVIKSDPRLTLDFNAIAQGYAVDVIYDYLDTKGLNEYLVEIGGEVRVRGDKGGAFWKIGIDRPEDNNFIPGTDLQAVISLKDRALATSGNYRKFYVENGIKYSHTIDPKTGYPVMSTLLSATILADNCALADGIATACMVMGKEKSISFLQDNPQFDAFLIYSDEKGNFQTWTTPGFEKYISEP
ncbi:MAG: FAD:protein FMN transferase [Bacteroidales bacterium]|nr:FAD:protein FMN transferase [Bacteroidales bacterium]